MNTIFLPPTTWLGNTRLHLPDESRTALDLFKDGFETKSYQVKAFYAQDDFVVFARRLGLVEKRFTRILKTFISHRDAVFALIDSSLLPEESKLVYKEHVNDRLYRSLLLSLRVNRGEEHECRYHEDVDIQTKNIAARVLRDRL